jgi:hypothetical protein
VKRGARQPATDERVRAGGSQAAGFASEFHYTPRHGSWLDMAEIELGILGRQCLARGIDNVDEEH